MDDPYTSTPCFGLFTCYVATWEIISSSLDFNEIHRDVHGRSFMKKGSFLIPFAHYDIHGNPWRFCTCIFNKPAIKLKYFVECHAAAL